MSAPRGLVMLALLWPASLAAQAPRGEPIRLSLEQAVARALSESEEIRAARVALQQAEARVAEARADALPSLRANLTYQRTFSSIFDARPSGPLIPPYEPDSTAPVGTRLRYLEEQLPLVVPRGIEDLTRALPFGRRNTWVGSLSLSQTLYSFRLGAALAGARAYRLVVAEQAAETRRDVVFRVTQAYVDAAYAERLVEIAEGAQRQADAHLRQVRLYRTAGTSSEYDQLRSEVEAANQEPEVVAARNAYDLALYELKRLVNLPLAAPVVLESPLDLAPDSLPALDEAALEEPDLSARAVLGAARAAVEGRRQAVRAVRADGLPNLSLQMTYAKQAFPTGAFPSGSDFLTDWTASVVLSVPLFDGLRTRAATAIARTELANAELDLAATRELVVVEIARARAEVERARSLLGARRATVRQAIRAQQLAGVRFANGIATTVEVSDARLLLNRTQVNEAQAARDYLVAIAELERALGRPVPLRALAQPIEDGRGNPLWLPGGTIQ